MAPVSVEAKRHIYAVSQGAQPTSQRFQRRHPPACRELMYIFDGDDNGVCRFIGTSYGQQGWVNPALSGSIKVSPNCQAHEKAAPHLSMNMETHKPGTVWAPGAAV